MIIAIFAVVSAGAIITSCQKEDPKQEEDQLGEAIGVNTLTMEYSIKSFSFYDYKGKSRSKSDVTGQVSEIPVREYTHEKVKIFRDGTSSLEVTDLDHQRKKATQGHVWAAPKPYKTVIANNTIQQFDKNNKLLASSFCESPDYKPLVMAIELNNMQLNAKVFKMQFNDVVAKAAKSNDTQITYLNDTIAQIIVNVTAETNIGENMIGKTLETIVYIPLGAPLSSIVYDKNGEMESRTLCSYDETIPMPIPVFERTEIFKKDENGNPYTIIQIKEYNDIEVSNNF